MKRPALISCVLLSVLCAAAVVRGPALADVPQLLHYQGVLTDGSGAAVADGPYDITFGIYDVAAGGSPLWTETNTVQVTKGIFDATLGTLVMLGGLPFDRTYYIGLSVEGGAELPRQILTASPFAFSARGVAGTTNVFPGSGNVGVGVAAPAELLEVAGGVRIANTATANAGTMRWTGSDFEGYDGSVWRSLTATGGEGGLPSGTSGQTLRHDGVGWVATSGLYNDGSRIGLGTTAPLAKIHVEGAGSSEEILINKTDAEGRGVVRLKSPGGTYDHFALTKYGSISSVTIDGISLASMSLLDAGINAGAMMLRVATANPMHFLTSNTERMRLLANGNLGINTKNPEAKLHVDGDQWDVVNTEGDVKIGTVDYRLKFGVETSGGAAGTARMFAAGGAQKLILGGGTSEVLSIDGAGNTSIGGKTSNAKLRLFRSGIDSAVVHFYTTAQGGGLALYDATHALASYLEADPSGEGGYFSVRRNAAGGIGFYVDGNYGGTTEPRVAVLGSARSAQFRMDQSDNGSVLLPANAIGASEILDEPGVASYAAGNDSTLLYTGDVTVIGSRSITTPAPGYVLVVATGQASTDHTNGQTSWCEFGVSNSSTIVPENQDVAVRLAAYSASGLYNFPVTVHGLFQVAAAGTYTYYFLGHRVGGLFICYDAQLTLVYLPTSYGTVTPTVAGNAAGAAGGAESPELGAAGLAERAQSIADNAARVERELAEMRARIEELEREARNR